MMRASENFTPLDETIRRMDIAEFRRLGYLQEVNRLFLHPLGLALEVHIDQKDGAESLGSIWDYRENAEGMFFNEKSKLSVEAADRIEAERLSKVQARIERFGFAIQPISNNK